MTRRDFGNVRRLESGRFQARYVDRNGFARRRFGEYAQEWLDSRVDLKPTTRQQYAGTLRRHVLPQLGGYALEELSSSRVRSWYAAAAEAVADLRGAVVRSGR